MKIFLIAVCLRLTKDGGFWCSDSYSSVLWQYKRQAATAEVAEALALHEALETAKERFPDKEASLYQMESWDVTNKDWIKPL